MQERILEIMSMQADDMRAITKAALWHFVARFSENPLGGAGLAKFTKKLLKGAHPWGVARAGMHAPCANLHTVL